MNTSRGGWLSESDLVRVLTENRIAGAAWDVRGTEGSAKSALSAMDNVILTPHVGAFKIEGQKRVASSVCADTAAVLQGEGALDFANFARPRR